MPPFCFYKVKINILSFINFEGLMKMFTKIVQYIVTLYRYHLDSGKYCEIHFGSDCPVLVCTVEVGRLHTP